MTNENDLLVEVGVHYRHPKNETESVPVGMKECHYKTFRDGEQLLLVSRVFVLEQSPNDFYRLIDKWNRSGVDNGWTYVGA